MSEPRHDGDTGDVDYEDVDGQVRTGDEHEETEELTPSKVVHVRGLPRGVVEKELNALAIPFGDVVKTLIIQTKGQAFIEMESVAAVRKMLEYYSKTEANLKGRRIFFQFSNREEIKLRGPSRDVGSKTEDQDRPNKILLVSILDCRVAITIQDLHQVFCQYGEVDKIVTFVKNNVFKTLIQYRYTEYAINAKMALDGKQMYQGCCVFHILFSRLTDLKVKTNTARARDFTVPPEKFPPHFQTPLASTFPLQPDFRRQGYGTPSKQPIFSGYPPGYNDVQQPDYMGNVKGSVLLVTNLVEQKVTPDVLFTLFGVYGDVQRVKIFYNKQHSALVQMTDAYQASLAQLHLNHVDLFGKSLTILPSKHASVSLPHPSLQKSSNLARDYSASPLHRFKFNRSKNFRHICPPGPVLHVSNLAEDATAEGLRGLFGAKVTAVQFFKTDRRMAFVRMTSTADAVAALVRLHNTKVAGKPVKVSFSPKKPAQIEDDFKSEESSAQSTSESYDTHTITSTKSKTGKQSSPSPTTKGRSTGSSQSSTAVAPRSVSTTSTTRPTQSQTRGSSTSPSVPQSTASRGKAAQASVPSQGTRPGQSRVVGSAPAARAPPRTSVSQQQGYYQPPAKQMHDPYALQDYYEQQGYREQKR